MLTDCERILSRDKEDERKNARRSQSYVERFFAKSDAVAGQKTPQDGSILTHSLVRLIASLVVMHGCFIYYGLLFRKWGGSFIPHLAYLGLSLTVFALAIKRPFLEPFKFSHILKGFLAAIVLYGVFFAGNTVSSRIVPNAGVDVMKIYNLAGGMPPLVTALLLAFPIAFGEEIFWRGCLQKYISERWSPRCGLFLTVTAYTLAHIASKNPILIGSAAICGLFWGWLYQRTGSILVCIISHMIWSPAVFALWPIK